MHKTNEALDFGSKVVAPTHCSVEESLSSADSFYAQGKYAESIANCTRALEIDSMCALAYVKRAMCHAAQEKYAESISDYANALAKNPQYVLAYNSDGKYYAAQRGDASESAGSLVTDENGKAVTLTFIPPNGPEAIATASQIVLLLPDYNGYKIIAQVPIEKGANAIVDGDFVLMLAACNNHTQVARLLIEKGANLEAKSNYDMTALMAAACNGHKEVVQCLIDKGAKLNAANAQGLTALMLAAYKGHMEVVRVLIKGGAELEISDSEGDTALICAAHNGHTKVAQLLIEGGAKLEASDIEGNTAVMCAAYNGQLEVTQLLIERGAELTGETMDTLARLLRQVDDKLEYGKTAVTCVAQNGQSQVAELLTEPLKRLWLAWLGKMSSGNEKTSPIKSFDWLLFSKSFRIVLNTKFPGYTGLEKWLGRQGPSGYKPMVANEGRSRLIPNPLDLTQEDFINFTRAFEEQAFSVKKPSTPTQQVCKGKEEDGFFETSSNTKMSVNHKKEISGGHKSNSRSTEKKSGTAAQAQKTQSAKSKKNKKNAQRKKVKKQNVSSTISSSVIHTSSTLAANREMLPLTSTSRAHLELIQRALKNKSDNTDLDAFLCSTTSTKTIEASFEENKNEELSFSEGLGQVVKEVASFFGILQQAELNQTQTQALLYYVLLLVTLMKKVSANVNNLSFLEELRSTVKTLDFHSITAYHAKELNSMLVSFILNLTSRLKPLMIGLINADVVSQCRDICVNFTQEIQAITKPKEALMTLAPESRFFYTDTKKMPESFSSPIKQTIETFLSCMEIIRCKQSPDAEKKIAAAAAKWCIISLDLAWHKNKPVQLKQRFNSEEHNNISLQLKANRNTFAHCETHSESNHARNFDKDIDLLLEVEPLIQLLAKCLSLHRQNSSSAIPLQATPFGKEN